ncbi:MAG: homocysteine S-methyltransferase family protein [Proteobacteria bacterium]|nr:homocysteine S-methyltransferase family protein [Pseudomonadota bacterium]
MKRNSVNKHVDIIKHLKTKGYLVSDGATGTELINAGVLKKGISPDHILLNDPDAFVKVHRSYYEAGSDYTVANNFGATRTKLEEWGLQGELEKINRVAIQCVKKALKQSGKKGFVASSIGPTGRLLPPMGNATMEELIDIYKEQIKIIYDEGVDLFVIETMSDMREAKAAYIAIRDICNVPVGVCLTFDANAKTLFNNSPESFAVTFDATDVLFLGVNCSVGPKDVTPIIQRIGEYTSKPIVVNANAGTGYAHFEIGDFTSQIDQWIAAGARIFGGCCGTTPDYIKAISKALAKKKMKKKLSVKLGTHLASLSKVVSVGENLPTAIIGERINPTNKKDMIDELKHGTLELVKEYARKQIDDGAHLLDVNLGAAGVDQVKLMSKTFQMLSALFEAPLVVDSSKVEAIEAALRAYGGKALINSTTADKDKAEKIFKLAAKYGAAVIGLTMNEKGIPMSAGERFVLASGMLKLAKAHGIKPENLVIDTLTLSLSSNQKEVMETIKTLELVKNKLHLSTILGVSNVSYGLPARENLNQTFLTLAINAGLNLAIVNPSSEHMKKSFDTMNVINGYDAFAVEYINEYAKSIKPEGERDKSERPQDPMSLLRQAIIDGDDSISVVAAKAASGLGLTLVDIATKSMIPAIEVVGKYFKDGRYFLPQVVLSAQAMKKAFEILKAHDGGQKIEYKAKVVMATVKGDIHDIGKNIVITLLETNGFEVIDLGKSISAEDIVKKAKELNPDFIGLSALMTTTMEEMGIVIKELKKAGLHNIPVMVGGAVVTQDFANSIGAKFYAKDAMQAVELLNQCKSK